jgi:hypothetical protein
MPKRKARAAMGVGKRMVVEWAAGLGCVAAAARRQVVDAVAAVVEIGGTR